jgi:hypothetical protein
MWDVFELLYREIVTVEKLENKKILLRLIVIVSEIVTNQIGISLHLQGPSLSFLPLSAVFRCKKPKNTLPGKSHVLGNMNSKVQENVGIIH